MEEILDLIAQDSKSAEISDKIKDVLYTKSAEKVEALRPGYSTAMFDDSEVEAEPEQEVAQEEE